MKTAGDRLFLYHRSGYKLLWERSIWEICQASRRYFMYLVLLMEDDIFIITSGQEKSRTGFMELYLGWEIILYLIRELSGLQDFVIYICICICICMYPCGCGMKQCKDASLVEIEDQNKYKLNEDERYRLTIFCTNVSPIPIPTFHSHI